MALRHWSRTASGNASPPGISWAEGMPPSGVNNAAREEMAQLRAEYTPSNWQWVNCSATASVISQTTVAITGDQTADYTANRRARLVSGSTTRYATIVSSSFGTQTVVTLSVDSGSLSASHSIAAVAALTNDGVPRNSFAQLGATNTFTAANLFQATTTFSAVAVFQGGIAVSATAAFANAATFAGAETHTGTVTFTGAETHTGTVTFAGAVAFTGSVSFAAAARQWTTAIKTADETITNDTVLNDDAALQFPVLATTNYAFRLVISILSDATADWKWSFNGPVAPTFVQIAAWIMHADGATVKNTTRNTAFGTSNAETTTSTGEVTAFVYGIVQNGANAGTVAFQWAQNTSSGNSTTLRAGSYLEYIVLQ